MKENFLIRAAAVISIAITSTLIAFAGPLRGNDVPQNPAWVAHIDFDSVRSNAIGKFLLAEMDKPENQQKIAAMTAIFGMDIRTQIHAVTLFASAESMNEPVLLVYGEFDTNRLISIAKGAQEYDAMEHGQHTVHSWLDEKKKKPDGSHPRVYAALQGTTLLIFSPSRRGVAGALDVLDKKADDLGANAVLSKLLKSADNKTFLVAAAPKLILPPAQARNPFANLATHVRLSLQAADNDEVSGLLNIGGKDENVARSIASIAQGITGLVKAQQDKPKLSELAGKATVKQEGNEVTVELSAPADEVINWLKLAAAHKKAKR